MNKMIDTVVTRINQNSVVSFIFSVNLNCNLDRLHKSVLRLKKKTGIPLFPVYHKTPVVINDTIFIFIKFHEICVLFSHYFYDGASIFKILQEIDLLYQGKKHSLTFQKNNVHSCFYLTREVESYYTSHETMDINKTEDVIKKLQKFTNLDIVIDHRFQTRQLNKIGNLVTLFYTRQEDSFIKKLKATQHIKDFPRCNYFKEPVVYFNSYLKFKLPSFIDEFVTTNIQNIFPAILITPKSNKTGKCMLMANKPGLKLLKKNNYSFND